MQKQLLASEDTPCNDSVLDISNASPSIGEYGRCTYWKMYPCASLYPWATAYEATRYKLQVHYGQIKVLVWCSWEPRWVHLES